MQFTKRLHEGIRNGDITVSVRIWQRPHVRVGNRYKLGDGMIHVDALREIELSDITPQLARRSGFNGVVDLSENRETRPRRKGVSRRVSLRAGRKRLMFGTHDLWLFVLSGLLLNVAPGPDTFYILSRTASRGWRGGAVAALGIGSGCFVHIVAAALGLSALLAASATAFTVLKWVGGAYLVWMGVSMLRTTVQTPGSGCAGAAATAATACSRRVSRRMH